MWVKICGNTTLEDAQLAVEAGANALGFIFASSPRQITPTHAATIVTQLPSHIETYGVFDTTDFEEITAAVEEAGLTGIQLHAGADIRSTIELAARLRQHFKQTSILHVLHYHEAIATDLAQLSAEHSIEAVLVDSRTATQLGGTGHRFDWHGAQSSFQDSVQRLRLIAAGGLNSQNVTEAIHTLNPWGVDVVSGVEASPGKKDPKKLRDFIARVRLTE